MNVNPDETKSKVFSPENASVAMLETDTSTEKSSTSPSVKKRTWKKPKDKPKRPLSSYNIFFQHQRTRIIEGHTAPATPEEIVRSIDGILSKSKEKRRHRKSHGRISFGDLARAIAEQWKAIDPQSKSIFDHYAEVDTLRYKREVKVWKEKKEMESEANAIAKHSNFIKSMNSSFSSQDSNSSFLDNLPDESNRSDSRPHNRQGDMHESFNSSFTSVDSRGSDYGMEPEPEPEPIQHMLQRQQQILQQQLRGVNPNFMGTTLSLNINDSSSSSSSNNSHQVWRDQKMPYVMPGSNAFHSSFSNMNNFSNLQQQQHQRGTGMLGHSSFGDTQQHRGQLSFGNFQNNQQIIPNTMQQFGNSSLQSLQLGDALHGVSNHASDYSSSAPHCQMQSSHSSGFSASFHSGFANSYSSGFQHSDGLAPPSATHDVMQISNHSSNYGMPMHQQQQQQQQQPGNLDRKRSEDVTNTMN